MSKNRAKNTISKVVFLWFTTIFLVANIVNAASVESMTVVNTLNEDLSINEILSIQLTNNTQETISLILPAGAYDIAVNKNVQKPINDSVSISLSCETCSFNLSYTLDNTVKKASSDTFTFSRTLNFPLTVNTLEYSVKLPIGYVIGSQSNSSDPSIVPQVSSIKTDGKSIILSWSKNNPELPQRYFVEYYSHENTENTMSEIKGELSEWGVWVIAIIFMGLGVILGFSISKKIAPEKERNYVIPSSLLSPDEKTILKTLKENKNTMNQKEIGKELNWSKSKISAIMTNLEYKEIISREKFGRNYKVTVIKDIEEL